jgi:hypothetical protein
MNANRAPLDDLGVFAMMATALAIKPLGRDAQERGYLAAKRKPSDAATPRRGLLDRLDHWFWKCEQRALEAYLGEAKDVSDLEARIRDLERGARYRYC